MKLVQMNQYKKKKLGEELGRGFFKRIKMERINSIKLIVKDLWFEIDRKTKISFLATFISTKCSRGRK